MLKEAVNCENYEDVSLFTSIPVKETTEHSLYKIYVDKSIKPFWKKSNFKKLLVKLTKQCIFSVNSRLIKHIDGCLTGGLCLLFLRTFFVCKIEEDVVVPAKPIFDKRYVDDTYKRRKKKVNDELLQNLNSYHTNIKLTLEESPRKFLDAGIIKNNNSISTQVFPTFSTQVKKVSCLLEFRNPN